MKTIHIIFNAHIDPIWLWPWQSGLDELLATCRSACDRLDAHPDLTFNRGEAWVYDQIERIDPDLFARIRKHVASGRWEVVGGWWIQPDCNQPSGFAMERQISLGKEYFESRFGHFPRIGYNVDSFGHSAALPGLMRAAGQDRYIMMRPEPHEMTLPAALFRWRGFEGSPEVVTYRIVAGYAMWNPDTSARIKTVAESIPDEIGHGMLFAGIGDHGGGPTEAQIAWFREHWNSFPGVKLEFSTASRFFDAVADKTHLLPVVTGELQQHAVGCYSVYRPIKTALRKAEHLLHEADLTAQREPSLTPPETAANLTASWQRVAFNQFHDTLGGTCIPSAYWQPLAQLGYAINVADDLLQTTVRRKMNSLPDDTLQRIVFYNASELPYSGPVEFHPWLDWKEWNENWQLIDESGKPVPVQIIASEALLHKMPNLLLSITVQPGEMRVLRLAESGGSAIPTSAANLSVLTLDGKLSVTPDAISFADGSTLAIPTLELIEDTTDTWSHNIDRYSDDVVANAVWEAPSAVDCGPVMSSWIQHGTISDSALTAEWRVYGGSFAELRLTVAWRERHKLLKMVQRLPGSMTHRTDGILGGWLSRPFDDRELPLRDGIVVSGDAGVFGIAAPDVYGVDATTERIRFTLLRSAIMAHHLPNSPEAPRRTFTDQYEHTFTFRYFAGQDVTPASIDEHAFQIHRPLIAADLTRGMPVRRMDM
ncbi:MAG TPA: glycoside hydrolase family 38 C-terminal domain-containing protein [Capsulimonadaceae bacterium]|jgi:alpha-mannosidase